MITTRYTRSSGVVMAEQPDSRWPTATTSAPRTWCAGDPVPTANPDHQPIVPPMAGFPPYCTCGVVGGNGHDAPLLADHLRQYDPEYDQ